MMGNVCQYVAGVLSNAYLNLCVFVYLWLRICVIVYQRVTTICDRESCSSTLPPPFLAMVYYTVYAPCVCVYYTHTHGGIMQSRREVGISMGAGKRKCCRGAATAATPTIEQRTEKSEHYTTSYNKNALNKCTGKEHQEASGNYFC